jgi:membrane-bound lytic murein transglycosylase D
VSPIRLPARIRPPAKMRLRRPAAAALALAAAYALAQPAAAAQEPAAPALEAAVPAAIPVPAEAGTEAAAAPGTAVQARPTRLEPWKADAVWGPAGPPAAGRALEPSYGIAMPWGERSFEAFRSTYSAGDARAWLEAVMARAAPYLPYIYERIRLYGLPDELAFLPVVESEFSPRAVSKSGAAGLWQFMKNSISGYGIRVDDWVDERRDVMKSTDGALRKLADNYATFGDWSLALAAYNAGAGAIGRAVAAARRAGAAEAGYWELRGRGLVSAECASYVPKFLAIASILRYPARSGAALSWDESPAWETISPGRSVDIALVAKSAGIDPAVLREANPELRHGVTPPSAGYLLKVPAASAQAVRAAIADRSAELLRYSLHSVRSGDTLSSIARNYGSTMSAIIQSNPGINPDLIRLGQVIVVPALFDVPPPSSKPAEAEDEGPAFDSTYVVAKGDTLWSLSLKYSVQVELLAARNGLSVGGVIREGTSLRVPILVAKP